VKAYNISEISKYSVCEHVIDMQIWVKLSDVSKKREKCRWPKREGRPSLKNKEDVTGTIVLHHIVPKDIKNFMIILSYIDIVMCTFYSGRQFSFKR